MDGRLEVTNGHVGTLDLRGLRRATESGVMCSGDGVDLSGVDFVTVGGMVGLACLVEGWAAERGPVPFMPPCDEVAGYMVRMDFLKHLGSKVSLGRSLAHLGDRSRHPAPLSEIRTVRDSGDVTVVTARFRSILLSSGVGEAEVQHCCHVLSESLTNVLYHAESPCGAYTAIQKWAKRDEVCVAVADAGLGIPGTIRDLAEARGGAFVDHELIRIALEPRVSRRPGAGYGGGLDRALRSVGDGSGRMKIWSGSGWVESRGVSRNHGTRSAHAFRGTCLEAVFPLGNTRT